MSTVGIVCEYNPFHKGHEYQIQKAREITGAEHVICFMSGCFLQRGVPAITDKYTRTDIALSCGADIVFEIPFVYSTASARDYAYAAVVMMNRLGIVDYISFGAETDDIELLYDIAGVIADEPAAVSDEIKKWSSKGLCYGAARAKALVSYMKDIGNLTDILSSPNNILAIEYLCAIIKTGSDIKPALIPRSHAGYHSTSTACDICSAAAVRSILESGNVSDISRHVPGKCFDILSRAYCSVFPIFDDDISYLLSAARLSKSEQADTFMEKELANRLSRLDIDDTFSHTAQGLRCRNYTLTHVQRALIRMIAGLTTAEYALFKSGGTIYYARLLGLRKEAGFLLRGAGSSDMPVITKPAARNLSSAGEKMFSYDVNATRIYSNMIYQKFGHGIKDDYHRSVIVK